MYFFDLKHILTHQVFDLARKINPIQRFTVLSTEVHLAQLSHNHASATVCVFCVLHNMYSVILRQLTRI